jgi:hypothetical protein
LAGDSRWLFVSLLLVGKTDEAEQVMDGWEAPNADILCLYLARMEEGQKGKAMALLKKAADKYREGSYDDQVIASLLDGNGGTDPYGLYTGLSFDPGEGRTIALVLAGLYPVQRAQFLSLSKKYNFNIDFPYPVLNRIYAGRGASG